MTAVLADPAPGPPDYYWPYGTALIAGNNLDPTVQPVIAFVNGRVCGVGETLVATPGENVPESDLGRTVYRVDVRADGPRSDQAPGCGRQGDPVVLYFPLAGRIAAQQPAFKQGGERVNLDLATDLQYAVRNPLVARDGVQ